MSIPGDIVWEEACENCGHRVMWQVHSERTEPQDGFEEFDAELRGFCVDIHDDLVEVPCPHDVQTVELCPSCGHYVGMWAMGLAGTLDCPCDDMSKTEIVQLIQMRAQ